ncbi:MAG: quinone oxidoreductase family protein [Candidatus Dormibacteria bacterium]
MLAALIESMGQPPVVRQLDPPRPSPGQALVQVLAAALNPVDLWIASGRHHSGVPTVPYVPGSEGVGRVMEGPHPLPGTLVRFQPARGAGGTFAELALAESATCLSVPNGLDAAVAAALGVAGMAAWIALVDKAQLGAGERILVLGATGAVGRLAVQLARIRGASRIVAAGRDQGALARARELGANATVAIAEQDEEQLCQQFMAAAEGELDLVFDPLWGLPLQAALRGCRQGARIVHLGQSAGARATLDSGLIRGRQLRLLGHSSPATSWETRAHAYVALADLVGSGALLVDTVELPLSQVASAFARQATSPHAKLVLIPGG